MGCFGDEQFWRLHWAAKRYYVKVRLATKYKRTRLDVKQVKISCFQNQTSAYGLKPPKNSLRKSSFWKRQNRIVKRCNFQALDTGPPSSRVHKSLSLAVWNISDRRKTRPFSFDSKRQCRKTLTHFRNNLQKASIPTTFGFQTKKLAENKSHHVEYGAIEDNQYAREASSFDPAWKRSRKAPAYGDFLSLRVSQTAEIRANGANRQLHAWIGLSKHWIIRVNVGNLSANLRKKRAI